MCNLLQSQLLITIRLQSNYTQIFYNRSCSLLLNYKAITLNSRCSHLVGYHRRVQLYEYHVHYQHILHICILVGKYFHCACSSLSLHTYCKAIHAIVCAGQGDLVLLAVFQIKSMDDIVQIKSQRLM